MSRTTPVAEWKTHHAVTAIEQAEKHLAWLKKVISGAYRCPEPWQPPHVARNARLCVEKVDKYVKLGKPTMGTCPRCGGDHQRQHCEK